MMVQEVISSSKAQPQNASPAKSDDEFNFGTGFEKFSTNNKPVQGDNVNDFDFGSDVIQPKGSKQDEREFDFNFAGGSAAPQNKEPAPAQSNDLMDLLGGVDMNAQPEAPKENALNFFDAPANTSVLDQAANANQSAQSPFDFGGNAQQNNDPFSAQTQPSAQPQAAPAEKPKFQPNLAFMSGMQQPSQQVYGTMSQGIQN